MAPLHHFNGHCRIIRVDADSAAREHMATLGLLPGTRIRICRNNRSGCIVEVRGGRVALGRDIADCVMAEAVEPSAFESALPAAPMGAEVRA